MTTGSYVSRGATVNPSSYKNAAAVTPSDANELTTYSKALFFSATAAQTLKVIFVEGPAAGVTLTFGAAGSYLLPLEVKQVFTTGTTVTGIVALW
jgi:propanediol dehydratase large subunit